MEYWLREDAVEPGKEHTEREIFQVEELEPDGKVGNVYRQVWSKDLAQWSKWSVDTYHHRMLNDTLLGETKTLEELAKIDFVLSQQHRDFGADPLRLRGVSCARK